VCLDIAFDSKAMALIGVLRRTMQPGYFLESGMPDHGRLPFNAGILPDQVLDLQR